MLAMEIFRVVRISGKSAFISVYYIIIDLKD